MHLYPPAIASNFGIFPSPKVCSQTPLPSSDKYQLYILSSDFPFEEIHIHGPTLAGFLLTAFAYRSVSEALSPAACVSSSFLLLVQSCVCIPQLVDIYIVLEFDWFTVQCSAVQFCRQGFL